MKEIGKILGDDDDDDDEYADYGEEEESEHDEFWQQHDNDGMEKKSEHELWIMKIINDWWSDEVCHCVYKNLILMKLN